MVKPANCHLMDLNLILAETQMSQFTGGTSTSDWMKLLECCRKSHSTCGYIQAGLDELSSDPYTLHIGGPHLITNIDKNAVICGNC